MKSFAAMALMIAALLVAGCQSTGGTVDPALTGYCQQNGFGGPGDPIYQRCLIDNSLGGRGVQLDKRAVGANGT